MSDSTSNSIDPIIYDNPTQYDPYFDAKVPDLLSKSTIFNSDNSLVDLDIDQQLHYLAANNKNSAVPYRNLTGKEFIRYSDPSIPILQDTNLEEVYSQVHPTTWFGKRGVMDKMYKTIKTNWFSSTKALMSGFKAMGEGGDISSLWDNPYTEHLAETTERLEELMPFYQSEDQRDNPFAWHNLHNTIKQVAPSGGTAISAIIEMVAAEALFIAAGEGIGGPFGGAAGAIGGVARNLSALPKYMSAIAKSANSARKAMEGVRKVSQSINGVRVGGALANRAAVGTTLGSIKYVGTSLFAANGEAALEGKLAEKQYVESKIAEYVRANNGKYPGADEIEKFKEAAGRVLDRTYSLNLAILTASNMIQFPDLLKTKWALSNTPRFMSNRYFDTSIGLLNKSAKTGKAEKRGMLSSMFRFEDINLGGERLRVKPAGYLVEGFKDSITEGAEEYFQGVSSDYSSQYVDAELSGKIDDAKSFLQVAVDRASTNEGWIEAFGGALIGGVMSVRTIPSHISNVSKYNSSVDGYNKSTELLIGRLKHSAKSASDFKEALDSNNYSAAQRALKSSIHDLAQIHSSRGTDSAAMLELQELSDMSIDDFNAILKDEDGATITELDKANLLDFTIKEFETSLATIEAVNKWGAANPLSTDSIFLKKAKKMPLLSMVFGNYGDKANEFIWGELKKDYAKYLSNHRIHDTQINEILDELVKVDSVFGVGMIMRDAFKDNNDSPGNIVKQIVSQFKVSAKDKLKLNVDGANMLVEANLVKKAEEVINEKDPYKAFELIVENFISESLTPVIKELFYASTARNVFFKKSNELNTNAGVRERAYEIMDLLKYRYGSKTIDPIEEVTETSDETSDEDSDKAEESEGIPESDDTSTPTEEKEEKEEEKAEDEKEKEEKGDLIELSLGEEIEITDKSIAEATDEYFVELVGKNGVSQINSVSLQTLLYHSSFRSNLAKTSLGKIKNLPEQYKVLLSTVGEDEKRSLINIEMRDNGTATIAIDGKFLFGLIENDKLDVGQDPSSEYSTDAVKFYRENRELVINLVNNILESRETNFTPFVGTYRVENFSLNKLALEVDEKDLIVLIPKLTLTPYIAEKIQTKKPEEPTSSVVSSTKYPNLKINGKSLDSPINYEGSNRNKFLAFAESFRKRLSDSLKNLVNVNLITSGDKSKVIITSSRPTDVFKVTLEGRTQYFTTVNYSDVEFSNSKLRPTSANKNKFKINKYEFRLQDLSVGDHISNENGSFSVKEDPSTQLSLMEMLFHTDAVVEKVSLTEEETIKYLDEKGFFDRVISDAYSAGMLYESEEKLGKRLLNFYYSAKDGQFHGGETESDYGLDTSNLKKLLVSKYKELETRSERQIEENLDRYIDQHNMTEEEAVIYKQQVKEILTKDSNVELVC